jgi:guanine deaminase
MCISAIIWSNIKEVYYGNTQKDADEIGFRDDKIYEFIEKISTSQNTNLIKLTELDRNETIKTFEEFKNKQDKTIY